MNYNQLHTAVKQILDKTTGLELPAFQPEEFDFWINLAIIKFVKTRYSGFNVKKEAVEQTQKRVEDLRTLVKEVRITPTDPSTPATSYKPNSVTAALPDDYWVTLGEDVTITVGTTDSRVGVYQITSDKYSQLIEDPYSPHILHYDTAKPLRLFNGSVVEIIDDGNYTTKYYHLRYLKVPLFVTAKVYLADTTASGDIEPGVTYLVTETTGDVTYNSTAYGNNETFVGVNGVKTFDPGAFDGTVKRYLSNTDLPEFVHDEIVKMAANMLLENIEQPRYQTHMIELGTME